MRNVATRQWIERGSGRRVFDLLWRRLLDLKFYEYADNVSAAWIATRIKRVGTSRRSMFQEELGYIDGGSETLVSALVASIERQGGRIHLGTPAQQVIAEQGRVTGVQAGGRFFPAEAVISTVPTPYVSRLVPDLSDAAKAAYNSIRNIGVVCVVHKLKRSVTPHFWLNVVDETMAIPGLIEFSNLRPTPDTIVYVPYYMPTDNPKFSVSDEASSPRALAISGVSTRRWPTAIGSLRMSAARATLSRFANRGSPRGFRTSALWALKAVREHPVELHSVAR